MEMIEKLAVQSKSLLSVVFKKISLPLPNVLQKEFVGEMGIFIFFQYQVSSECCISKIIKIGRFFTVI